MPSLCVSSLCQSANSRVPEFGLARPNLRGGIRVPLPSYSYARLSAKHWPLKRAPPFGFIAHPITLSVPPPPVRLFYKTLACTCFETAPHLFSLTQPLAPLPCLMNLNSNFAPFLSASCPVKPKPKASTCPKWTQARTSAAPPQSKAAAPQPSRRRIPKLAPPASALLLLSPTICPAKPSSAARAPRRRRGRGPRSKEPSNLVPKKWHSSLTKSSSPLQTKRLIQCSNPRRLHLRSVPQNL
jgi:hypothetical protein